MLRMLYSILLLQAEPFLEPCHGLTPASQTDVVRPVAQQQRGYIVILVIKAVVDEEAVVGLGPGGYCLLDPTVAQPLVQPGVAIVAGLVVPERQHLQNLAEEVVVEVLHALVGKTHGVHRDPLLSQGIDEALRHVRPRLRALGVAVRKKYHFFHEICFCSKAAFKSAKARSRFFA